MSDTAPDPNYVDPLSEVTRRERKFLLAAASAALAIVLLHAVPKGIPSIGLDTLDGATQRGILLAIGIVVAYALVAFVIYAWSDFVAWRQSIAIFDANVVSNLRSPRLDDDPNAVFGTVDPKHEAELSEALQSSLGRHSKWARRARRITVIRAVWEFLMPVAVSLAAIASVMSAVAKLGAYQMQCSKVLTLIGLLLSAVGTVLLWWSSPSGYSLGAYADKKLQDDVNARNRAMRRRQWVGVGLISAGTILQGAVVFLQ